MAKLRGNAQNVTFALLGSKAKLLDIKNSVLAIPDQRYFESTGKSFTDMEWALDDALPETGFRGVAINAPANVALKQHATLPIFMAIQETRLRGWEVPVGYNCVLAATGLNRRTVYFGQVFRDPPNKIPIPIDELPQPSKHAGTNAISVSSGIDRIDARELLPLPWEPGRYRFTALLFDWMSNAVNVNLVDGTAAPAPHVPLLKLNPAGNGKNNDRVEGYFSVDTLEVGKPALAPGDYVAYLVVEGRMFGPGAFSSAPAVN